MRKMLRGITARQFLDWSEYATREPFGSWWTTLLFARLMQFYANANRDPKKQDPYKIEDFVLELVNDRPFRTQTWQQQKQIVKMIVEAWNSQEEQKEARRRKRNAT